MGLTEDLLKEENQFNVIVAVSIGVLVLILLFDPLGMSRKEEKIKTEKKEKVVDPNTKYTR